jgi:membrane associated rhomboid family serine protease
MGIYDRDYYRREGPSFLRSLSDTGSVCKWLIIINVAVFAVQLVMTYGGSGRLEKDSFTDLFDLNVGAVLHGEVWRLITYAFLHSTGNPLHIIFNMLFLWWFGNEIEEMYGSREFLAYYLTAAVTGALAYAAWELGTKWGVATTATDPALEHFIRPVIGASGAVTAVLVLYACHFPHRTIFLFYLLPIPIWLFVVLEVGMDAFGLLSGNSGVVAVAVHLGGAAFAFLYYKAQWRLLNLGSSVWSWLRSRRLNRPRLRVYREEEPPRRAPVAVAAAPKSDVDEHLEAKLDEVLEKVARFGQDSLTESERQILFRASEVYKKRRS